MLNQQGYSIFTENYLHLYSTYYLITPACSLSMQSLHDLVLITGENEKNLSNMLKIPDSYDAKIVKICNPWTFWLVIQPINNLCRILKRWFIS